MGKYIVVLHPLVECQIWKLHGELVYRVSDQPIVKAHGETRINDPGRIPTIGPGAGWFFIRTYGRHQFTCPFRLFCIIYTLQSVVSLGIHPPLAAPVYRSASTANELASTFPGLWDGLPCHTTFNIADSRVQPITL